MLRLETLSGSPAPILLDAAERGLDTVTIWEGFFTDHPECRGADRDHVSDVMLAYQSEVEVQRRSGDGSSVMDGENSLRYQAWRISWAVESRPSAFLGEEFIAYKEGTEPEPEEETLSLSEAADDLSCSTTTVRNRIKQGFLPNAVRVSVGDDPNRFIWSIPLSDVERCKRMTK